MTIHNDDTNSKALLNLLNNLKLEIKNLRTDINRLEETVLKERLHTIEETLSQNHLLVYANQRSEKLNEDINSLLKSGCQKKQECQSRLLATFENNSKIIEESGVKKAISDLDAKIAETELMVEKTKGYTCEPCFVNFRKRLKREKRAYQEIVLVEDVTKPESNTILDIPFLVDSLFEPLSNATRLKILVSIYQGKKSFSELSKLVDLKAGHLVFHLKKLVGAKLITQEASKGDYIITNRGLTLIKKMLSLQTENH